MTRVNPSDRILMPRLPGFSLLIQADLVRFEGILFLLVRYLGMDLFFFPLIRMLIHLIGYDCVFVPPHTRLCSSHA